MTGPQDIDEAFTALYEDAKRLGADYRNERVATLVVAEALVKGFLRAVDLLEKIDDKLDMIRGEL